MRIRTGVVSLAATLAAATLPLASGASFSEVGDAGQSVITAQLAAGPSGAPLTRIAGSLGDSEADLFRIRLSGGVFSASTISTLGNLFDTSLFLFTSSGLGVYANDDASGAQAALPARILPAGDYLLAITAGGYEPQGPGGPLFPPIDFFTVFPEDVRQATQGAGPLAAWAGFFTLLSPPVAYAIDLTGAEFAPIPEPATVALFAVGLAALAWRRRRAAACAALALVAGGLAWAQPRRPPAKIGGPLAHLVGRYLSRGASLPPGGVRDLEVAHSLPSGQFALVRGDSPLLVDRSERVLVDIVLSSGANLAETRAGLERAGARITGVFPYYRGGAISAYAPLDAIVALAGEARVASIAATSRPQRAAGSVTSQGRAAHRVDLAPFTGAGITVAVLSDSFNTCTSNFCQGVTAEADVATGDLPNDAQGPGLKALLDDLDQPGTVDEGRAMAQIVHDLAPQAKLCFATAFKGQASFAANILALREDPACRADIIVDDVYYYTEPFFSDGMIAQAVDLAATSTALAGRRVAFFSAAGNDGGNGYYSELRFVPRTTAAALPQPVDLTTVPAGVLALYDGFHDFEPGPGVAISQFLALGNNPVFSLQWDDPFDVPGGVTTDFDVFFFDPTTGQFLFVVNANNFATNQPSEYFGLVGEGGVRLVLARRNTGARLARRVKYFVQSLAAASEFIGNQSAVTFGHATARGAFGVGAYRYDLAPYTGPLTPGLEAFSSAGPAYIAFDAAGARLPTLDVRRKPDFSAANGVNTTFFRFGDVEGDGFPNFFGTSAAAPHAAAIAALLLQKAGGPGALSPAQIGTYLQRSTGPRADYYFVRGTAVSGAASVTLTANGTGAYDSGFFHLTVTAPGQMLTSLTIRLPGANVFDSRELFSEGGYPVTLGESSPGVSITSPNPNAVSNSVTLTFSGLSSGKFVRFGIDRDPSNGADAIAGATFTATLSGPGPATLSGTLANGSITGWRVYDGFGFIDAVNALALVP
ncbi:MAG: DVUA0089 family protein [Bryobacteraceae bacterium]|nr:DVUA0089 family protein [Bryobacteraceae bacterium]